jgi:hypothetical protein
MNYLAGPEALYVELPYGDETHAVPICKEITSGFHVETGLQPLMRAEGALGNVASSATQTRCHEIMWKRSIHISLEILGN